jgi:rhodanese-related sulfurtransferase
VALQMKKLGFRRVRPLQDGLQAWIDGGLPLVERAVRPLRVVQVGG